MTRQAKQGHENKKKKEKGKSEKKRISKFSPEQYILMT